MIQLTHVSTISSSITFDMRAGVQTSDISNNRVEFRHGSPDFNIVLPPLPLRNDSFYLSIFLSVVILKVYIILFSVFD